MTYDPDRDTRAPRPDRRASDPPLDAAAGIGNIWTAIILLTVLFVGGLVWLVVSGDTNVASNDPSGAAIQATTGSESKGD
jgi:hypothetical protein